MEIQNDNSKLRISKSEQRVYVLEVLAVVWYRKYARKRKFGRTSCAGMT